MVYCLYHHDVVGNSNLRDIRQYCDSHGITYLATVDFLYYAIQRNFMTKEEAAGFVQQAQSFVHCSLYCSREVLSRLRNGITAAGSCKEEGI